MELEGKRELYRVRVVNQLAVLLRMRINNVNAVTYSSSHDGVGVGLEVSCKGHYCRGIQEPN